MMMDMYRHPEMVLKAVERSLLLPIRQGGERRDMNGCPVVFMPLHKGADGFMSDEQFRKILLAPLSRRSSLTGRRKDVYPSSLRGIV